MDLEVQMEPGLPGQIDPVAGHPGKRTVEPEPVAGYPGSRTMQAEPETLAIWKRKMPERTGLGRTVLPDRPFRWS